MQIVITVTPDNQLSLSTSQDLNYNQLTDILGTAQMSIFRGLVNIVKEKEDIEEDTKLIMDLKEELWDQYNQTASNILDEMIPAHMRPDLSEQAILAEENKLWEKQLKQKQSPFKVVK